MKVNRFSNFSKLDESKKKEDKDISFDVSEIEPNKDDLIGFVSDLEEITDKEQNKIKKEIQNDGETPGLKKSIKKFEDFSVIIDLDLESKCDCCNQCTGEPGCNCCPLCECEPMDGNLDGGVLPFSEVDTILSEKMKYHLNNKISVVENVFRPGSESFISLIKEARKLNDNGVVRFSGQDRYLFENTDLGRFAMFCGEMVPLDLPMEFIEEVNEAEYKGREVKLNHPTRNTGSGKKYCVYVMNPKTDKVKRITFGDVHGGLKAKVSDSDARKAFAARHNCKDKKDKTKAGYWACRINRFGHLWNGRTYPGFW